MVQYNQKRDEVLELFFEYSTYRFTVREIAKKTRVPSSTVQRYLKKLRKEGFINKENKAVINRYFKFKKSLFLIDKLYKTGLIDYLNNELNPSLIIVFGSVRKGEYDSESDIDLFVESQVKKKLSLNKFEKKLKHKIQFFVESDINDLQPSLYNNVINGIKLGGYLKIK